MHGSLIRHLSTLAVCSSLVFCGTPAWAQQPALPPVTIVVPDDYPAFQPLANQSDPRAREVRALIFKRDPVGGDTSVILLNPAHLSAQTLSDALMALQRLRADTASEQPRRLVALGTGRPGRPVPPHAVGPLEARLAELRARPSVPLRRLGSAGRSIVVDDIMRYLPRPQQ